MFACQGKQLVSYPEVLGVADWPQIQALGPQSSLEHTGSSCVATNQAEGLRNSIVKVAGDNTTAWLVNAQLERQWIPTGTDYNCLVETRQSRVVDNVSAEVVAVLRDAGENWASCIYPDVATRFNGWIVKYFHDPKRSKDGSPQTAWYVKGGLRYWIADSKTYSCLTAKNGNRVTVLMATYLANKSDRTPNRLRDSGEKATCKMGESTVLRYKAPIPIFVSKPRLLPAVDVGGVAPLVPTGPRSGVVTITGRTGSCAAGPSCLIAGFTAAGFSQSTNALLVHFQRQFEIQLLLFWPDSSYSLLHQ